LILTSDRRGERGNVLKIPKKERRERVGRKTILICSYEGETMY